MESNDTKELLFYGVSDDLFEVDGPGGDEFSVGRSGLCVVKVSSPTTCEHCGGPMNSTEGLLVTGTYISPGVWSVGIAPLATGIPMPEWIAKFDTEPDGKYSARLTLRVPKNATVERMDDPR